MFTECDRRVLNRESSTESSQRRVFNDEADATFDDVMSSGDENVATNGFRADGDPARF